jgi:hypothetical protein
LQLLGTGEAFALFAEGSQQPRGQDLGPLPGNAWKSV